MHEAIEMGPVFAELHNLRLRLVDKRQIVRVIVLMPMGDKPGELRPRSLLGDEAARHEQHQSNCRQRAAHTVFLYTEGERAGAESAGASNKGATSFSSGGC